MRNHIYRNMLLSAGLLRAPPDELNGFGSFGGGNNGGGQGGNNGGGDGGELGSTQQQPLIGENDSGEDGEDKELMEIFGAFGSDDDSGDDFQPIQIGDIPQEDVDAMQTQVQQLIAQVRVPDNIIPENFDPNDRTQLQNLLTRTAQAAVSSSMGVVFKPVQLAMTQMAAQMKAHVDNTVKQHGKENRESNIIEDTVPEINDKRYSGMIRGMDAQLKAKGKKADERARLLRKMLNQMGIVNEGGNNRRSTGGTGQNNTASIRTGKSALDSFFGSMPKIG